MQSVAFFNCYAKCRYINCRYNEHRVLPPSQAPGIKAETEQYPASWFSLWTNTTDQLWETRIVQFKSNLLLRSQMYNMLSLHKYN